MKKTILLIVILCMTVATHAKVEMPNICKDGMVLQQNAQAVIWGTASPDAKITVSPSWGKASYKTTADADGRWEVKVATPGASYTAYTIIVKGDGSTVIINDVLIGEVWLASGQSNMQMSLEGYFNNPVEYAMDYITAPAATEKIRMFTVPRKQTYEPLKDVDAKWEGADPSTRPAMSAVAYFYALKLNEVLDIPVGIITSAYGGSHVEGWTPKEICETYPDVNLDREAIEKRNHMERPYLMYNAMICPVKGYTIKGFIWYQGCSEVGKNENFIPRMNIMIGHWRELWNDADNELPFYMVEIAPHTYGGRSRGLASDLRLRQHEAAKVIPNCGVVVTNDLVRSFERGNIHPGKKKEIGDRLAFMALNRDYGFKKLPYESPEAVKCVLRNNGEIAVEFSNVPNGLNRWQEIVGLEVAGSDGVFYPVTNASMGGDRYLKIKHRDVPNPCQVRYGWGDFNPGNLTNAMGLPVTPFWVKIEK